MFSQMGDLLERDLDAKDNIALTTAIDAAYQCIAPSWPLKDMVAVNPLQGMENLSFVQAMHRSYQLWQRSRESAGLDVVNRETIKWCQAYFDQGQAVFGLPDKDKGFYACFRALVLFDTKMHAGDKEKRELIRLLPQQAEQAILLCMKILRIEPDSYEDFFVFILSTLPGWASHVVYQSKWMSDAADKSGSLTLDYLAIRLILAVLLWPTVKNEYDQFKQDVIGESSIYDATWFQALENRENQYQLYLLDRLRKTKEEKNTQPLAQFIFCIDVRSESMRLALEDQGHYETFGFAGFFGVPVQIASSSCDSKPYASCPVLLKPKHTVKEIKVTRPTHHVEIAQFRDVIAHLAQRSYQMLKYMFVTPFMLVEMFGWWSGLTMLNRVFHTKFYLSKWSRQRSNKDSKVELTSAVDDQHLATTIPLEDQCVYAETLLKVIGLTSAFAPLVILCAHGAKTANNAYQAALDCGACGGHPGLPNALIMANILNSAVVRDYLAVKNIHIPSTTRFLAALHETTTDDLTVYGQSGVVQSETIERLNSDILQATKACRLLRYGVALTEKEEQGVTQEVEYKSSDWSEVRPEWGLARNASFIVAPRSLTRQASLDGRAFLHSYDWQQDPSGEALKAILLAPLIVGQWINAQYFFSTLDNIAYGGGSKVTQNITGKMGMMQGNASDLMFGLPLQSVNEADQINYHQLQRLQAVIYAPKIRIDRILAETDKLRRLVEYVWIKIICIDPEDNRAYLLAKDLEWSVLTDMGINE